MAARGEKPDARLNVARYRVEQLADEPTPAKDDDTADDDTALTGQQSMDARAQYVEISIQRSMRRGDFDDLPGAGKPIAGLTDVVDPDWWIRRKIEREKLTGLGPPALTLRTESAGMDERLDAVGSEATVREILDDFNRRVIEARRQLLGGPPVVTKTRDIDEEVARWRERRAAPSPGATGQPSVAEPVPRRWRRIRRQQA